MHSFLPACALATLVSGSHLSSSVGSKSFFEEQDDEIDTGTYVIEVTEFKSEVKFDPRGHCAASEAISCNSREMAKTAGHGPYFGEFGWVLSSSPGNVTL